MIDTAVDYPELNVDRTVSDGNDHGITINNAEASYIGTNVNLTVTASGTGSARGIFLTDGKSINLRTSGEGGRNTLTSVSENASAEAIFIQNATETTTISHTDIYVEGVRSEGIVAQTGIVELDDVNVHVSSHEGDGFVLGFGLYANSSTITNKGKGQVTIVSDLEKMGGAISSEGGGYVDLYNSSITVSAQREQTLPYGVLTITFSSVISLTNSTIDSANGNTLISEVSSGNTWQPLINLDKVNLNNAKNQLIQYSSNLNFNLSNGTNLDGYAKQLAEGTGSLILDISSGASWNVMQDSTTGEAGSLSLGTGCTISFMELGEGTFTNIISASIALEAGAILMLGATSEEIQALMDNNGGTYDVKLFTTDEKFSNEGVVLVTSDGRKLEYTPDNLGTYTLTGILIPEPATGVLWLASFGLLAFRRMKN